MHLMDVLIVNICVMKSVNIVKVDFVFNVKVLNGKSTR